MTCARLLLPRENQAPTCSCWLGPEHHAICSVLLCSLGTVKLASKP